jgi:hypothetical protein
MTVGHLLPYGALYVEQAGRGLVPRLGKSGHLGGVGSQWCNRLPRD